MAFLFSKRTKKAHGESISTPLAVPRACMKPMARSWSPRSRISDGLKWSSSKLAKISRINPSRMPFRALVHSWPARELIRNRRMPFGLRMKVSRQPVEVAAVSGVERSPEHLHVLLRHRLLRQPGGFEGRVNLVPTEGEHFDSYDFPATDL